MIQFYFYATLVIFVTRLLKFSDSVQSQKSSRVREMRVQSARAVKRDRADLILSLVWPVLLIRVLRDLYRSRRLVVPEYYERKKES